MLPQINADAVGWFRHTFQAGMLAPGKFEEDSVSFPPLTVLCIGRSPFNIEVVFEVLVYG